MSGTSPNPGAAIPFDTENQQPSLQAQLAQAKIKIAQADIEIVDLQNSKKKLKAELTKANAIAVSMFDGCTDYMNNLKRKHRAEVTGLTSDIDALTKVIREASELRPINVQGSDSKAVDPHGIMSDMNTRPRKKPRIHGTTADPDSSAPMISGVDSSGFIPGVPSLPQPGDFPRISQSAALNTSSNPSRPARPSTSFPVCIFCYMHNHRCDAGEPCKNCAQRGRTCKRAKCVKFEAGTCRNLKCLRAHEEDLKIYLNIRAAGHVRKKVEKGGKKGGTGGGGGDGGGRRIAALSSK